MKPLTEGFTLESTWGGFHFLKACLGRGSFLVEELKMQGYCHIHFQIVIKLMGVLLTFRNEIPRGICQIKNEPFKSETFPGGFCETQQNGKKPNMKPQGVVNIPQN